MLVSKIKHNPRVSPVKNSVKHRKNHNFAQNLHFWLLNATIFKNWPWNILKRTYLNVLNYITVPKKFLDKIKIWGSPRIFVESYVLLLKSSAISKFGKISPQWHKMVLSVTRCSKATMWLHQILVLLFDTPFNDHLDITREISF